MTTNMPVAIDPNTSQTLYPTNSVLFTATPDGVAPYTFRWYINGFYVGAGSNNGTFSNYNFVAENIGDFHIFCYVVDDDSNEGTSDDVLIHVIPTYVPIYGYCEVSDVKERMLVESADNSYDDSIDSTITEASRLVDLYLTPYTTVPLDVIPDIIKYITADFASSIFKRRMMPNEVKLRNQQIIEGMGDLDAGGWYAIGKSKLDAYIRSTYALEDTEFTWTSCTDPNQVLTALKSGAVTTSEARAILKAMTYDATDLVTAQIALINKQITVMTAEIAKMTAETAKITQETTQMAKRGTSFTYIDEDEPDEEE